MPGTLTVSADVLRWAARRAMLSDAQLTLRFRQWPQWLSGESGPSLRQLEKLAKLCNTATGYFFLPQAPVLKLPIADFRSAQMLDDEEPSSALLDTLHACQNRQAWYKEHLLKEAAQPPPLVGCNRLEESALKSAAAIRCILNFTLSQQQECKGWEEALRRLVKAVEEAGVLVMINSVVNHNNRRKLDLQEFRAFSLCDKLAPLIFINGADSKAAQMFSIAHELAHISLGLSGISDSSADSLHERKTEEHCNRVAAEFLVPIKDIKNNYLPRAGLDANVAELGRLYKVSSLVILRRLFDAGFIDPKTLREKYRLEQERFQKLRKTGRGGDFYRSLIQRNSRRFTQTLVNSTMNEETLLRDALSLLGIKSLTTFDSLAVEFGADDGLLA
jgi:Zn-dependent peptidase ImmA (M78 family)